MSRIFDSLRQAEQETKEGTCPPAADNCGAAEAIAARNSPGEKGEETKIPPDQEATAQPRPEPLGKQIDSGRVELENLLAKIEQAREEWQAELEKSRRRIEENGLEQFRTAAAALKADLLKEVASMSLGAAQQAEKRFQEKVAATEQDVRKSLEDFARNLSVDSRPATPNQTGQSKQGEPARLEIKIQGELAAAQQDLREFVAEQLAGAHKALSARLDAAVDSMKQLAEQAAAKGLAEGRAGNLSALSETTCDEVRDKLDAMAGSFLEKMEQTLLSGEEEALKKLGRSADSLVESSTQLVQKHTEDALDMFREELASSSRKAVDEALNELAKAKGTVESLSIQVREAAENFRVDFQNTVNALQEMGEQQLEASFQKILEKQRPATLRQIQEEIEPAQEPERSKLIPRPDLVRHEPREEVRAPAGRESADIKEWIAQVRQSLTSNSQKSFEAFAKQIAAVSGAALESYRQDMGRMFDDLNGRLERASRALATDRAVPKPAAQPDAPPPTTGELTAQLQRAVDQLLKLAVENSKKSKTNP